MNWVFYAALAGSAALLLHLFVASSQTAAGAFRIVRIKVKDENGDESLQFKLFDTQLPEPTGDFVFDPSLERVLDSFVASVLQSVMALSAETNKSVKYEAVILGEAHCRFSFAVRNHGKKGYVVCLKSNGYEFPSMVKSETD